MMTTLLQNYISNVLRFLIVAVTLRLDPRTQLVFLGVLLLEPSFPSFFVFFFVGKEEVGTR